MRDSDDHDLIGEDRVHDEEWVTTNDCFPELELLRIGPHRRRSRENAKSLDDARDFGFKIGPATRSIGLGALDRVT